MPLDPCGHSNAEKNSDTDASDRSGDTEEELVQQTIGALKIKYKDTLNDAIRDFEFIVKVGSPDVEVIKYAKQNDIDMIILGAQRTRYHRSVLCSINP